MLNVRYSSKQNQHVASYFAQKWQIRCGFHFLVFDLKNSKDELAFDCFRKFFSNFKLYIQYGFSLISICLRISERKFFPVSRSIWDWDILFQTHFSGYLFENWQISMQSQCFFRELQKNRLYWMFLKGSYIVRINKL